MCNPTRKLGVTLIGFVLTMLLNSIAYAIKTEINVGIYAPFSTEHSFIGRTILGTMEELRDQLNSDQINYTFYPLDRLPANSRQALILQQFIKAHQIKVILTQGVVDGQVIAPIAKQNNIIHFSLAANAKIADGTNNFLAWSPDFERDVQKMIQVKKEDKDDKQSLAFTESLIKKLQQHSPLANLFQLLDHSVLMAIKEDSNCSSEQIAAQIHQLAIEPNKEIALNMDKRGVLYSKSDINYAVGTA